MNQRIYKDYNGNIEINIMIIAISSFILIIIFLTKILLSTIAPLKVLQNTLKMDVLHNASSMFFLINSSLNYWSGSKIVWKNGLFRFLGQLYKKIIFRNFLHFLETPRPLHVAKRIHFSVKMTGTHFRVKLEEN